MVDPVVGLVIAGILLLLTGVLLVPRKGLLDRWRAMRARRERTTLEDALKHAYHCEYSQLTCSLQSMAGVLQISEDDAAGVATRLEQLGLLNAAQGALSLTDDGRSYALRVIRVHRLWERYLADESGLEETEWHAAAELQEHRMTPADADALAARLGNPRFDPHGDPIPTPSGELPARAGIPLNDLPPGASAKILHIEDEPPAVYAQLVAQGLSRGMTVRMVTAGPQRIVIVAEGEECVLAPLLARNITVRPVDPGEDVGAPTDTLAALPIGMPAVVLGLSRVCRGQQRRRLMDLGIVRGTEIVPEMESVGGDPTAYRVRGSLIALRKKQAEQVFVRLKETKE